MQILIFGEKTNRSRVGETADEAKRVGHTGYGTTFEKTPKMPLKQIIFFVACFLFASIFSGVRAAEDIRVSWRYCPDGSIREDRWQLLVMARADTLLPDTTPIIRCEQPIRIDSVFPEKSDIRSDRFALFCIALSSDSTEENIPILVSIPGRSGAEVRVSLSKAVDLLHRDWQGFYAGNGLRLDDIRTVPDTDSDWKKRILPQSWNEIGVTWLRTSVFIPERWKNVPVYLTISAVDDNEVSFVNGKEVGRTNGWDTLRHYEIRKNVLKFGEINEIVIAAENTGHGGGIKGGPVRIGPTSVEGVQTDVLFPTPPLQHEADRCKPRTPGRSLPLRPMTVRDAVLEYVDGGEVALWGINYYAQSTYEYRSLKNKGVDPKTAIDADLDDLLQNGNPDDPNRINVIRIHVYDSEICDSEGNLHKNEHLDLLDYLAWKCNERGVYLWLTPIAWWGGAQPIPACFTECIPMQAMTLCKETWPAQQRYLRSFLEHENPYTKRRLVDEPCLALFEIINEPLYWSFSRLVDRNDRSHGQAWPKAEIKDTDRDPNVVFRDKIRAEWNETLPGKEWESSDSWSYFVYARILEYIDTMHETIRSTGGKQPIAYNAADFNTISPVFQAIGDSRCEAVSLVYYISLEQKPVGDDRNQLPRLADRGLPAMLSEKVRLAYEFDASDTLQQIDNYPAIARYFRNQGVQVACQFQYDSRFNAAENRSWPTHYLNAIHTPERFSSFLIGGETFRTLPRGARYKPKNPDQWIFPPAAVSYSFNAALLCKNNLYMQARPTGWQPFPLPESPRRMIGVGSTPYYDYAGTGMVDLNIDGDTAGLRLQPDVVRLRKDTLQATREEPLTKLKTDRHPFKLKLPGWEKAVLEIETTSGQKKFVPLKDHELETGKTHRLKREP